MAKAPTEVHKGEPDDEFDDNVGDIETQRAGGLLDNLQGLDFPRVIGLVQSVTADIKSRNWVKLFQDVGALTIAVSGIYAKEGETVSPRMSASPEHAAHAQAFDDAARLFDDAKNEGFQLASSAGPSQTVGIDIGTIMVIVELAEKLVDAFKNWRKR